MSILSEPTCFSNLALRNRFVRSATNDVVSDASRRVAARQERLVSDPARGGVRLCIEVFGSAAPLSVNRNVHSHHPEESYGI